MKETGSWRSFLRFSFGFSRFFFLFFYTTVKQNNFNHINPDLQWYQKKKKKKKADTHLFSLEYRKGPYESAGVDAQRIHKDLYVSSVYESDRIYMCSVNPAMNNSCYKQCHSIWPVITFEVNESTTLKTCLNFFHVTSIW